jgi:post-segregation antitoxin (ccd killing protein)
VSNPEDHERKKLLEEHPELVDQLVPSSGAYSAGVAESGGLPQEQPDETQLKPEASSDYTPEIKGKLIEFSTLNRIEYDHIRAKQAKALGVRVSTLDAEVGALRESKREMQGTKLMLADPEPWHEPVGGPELLDEIKTDYNASLSLPPGGDVALTLWTVFAHAHNAFQVSPILAATSAIEGCGKSWLLMMVWAHTPRPLSVANVTVAAVFRIVDRYRPCFLLDEGDTYIGDRDELRGVLNSGWLRPQAYAVRCEGDENEPRLFCTWAPKAIATIGALPRTLASRSIEIRMDRQSPDKAKAKQSTKAKLEDLAIAFDAIRRKAWRWAQDNLEAIRTAKPAVPTEFVNRTADNWRPLLAIADVAGGNWPELARDAMRQLAGAGDTEEQALGVTLLADLKEIFSKTDEEGLFTSELLETLLSLPERPWGEVNHGKALNSNKLGRLLKQFRTPKARPITSGDVHKKNGGHLKGYHKADFVDAFESYVPDPSPATSEPPSVAPPPLEKCIPCKPSIDAGLLDFSDQCGKNSRTDEKGEDSPLFMRVSTECTDSDPGAGEEGNPTTVPGDDWTVIE